MKPLRLEYFNIKHLYNFQRKTQIQKRGIKNLTFRENDIISVLNTISPEKALHRNIQRNTKNSRHLSLVFTPNLPFGPDPELVIAKLFGTSNEFENAIKLIINFFNMDRFEIQDDSKIFRHPRNSLPITLLEAYSLFRAASEGIIEKKYPFPSF